MISVAREREANILRDGSLKTFYKYVNSKLSPCDSQHFISVDNGSSLLSPTDSASALNNHFAKSFTADLHNVEQFPPRSNVIMPIIAFSADIILPYLLGQKDTFTVGTDGLPQVLFKKCANSLCNPLSIIFSRSYLSGTIPSSWRCANVIPIFKGSGSIHSPENYRPISLTCIASKIMKLIIRDSMLSFLLSNNLITSAQHGFLPGKSTTTNLVETLNDFTISLDAGLNVDCIYLDFSKAFDCISHSELITKLYAYGVDVFSITWIKNFLTDRKQRVKINSVCSDWLPCLSGVPQGSVLGPLLFVLFTIDLPDIVFHAKIKMYADDVKIYLPVFDLSSHALLQEDLNRIVAWAVKWKLKLNAKKCFLLRLKPNLNLPSYMLDNTLHVVPDVVKDLGVFITPKLDFSYHCNHIANIAFKRRHLILSAFITRDNDFIAHVQCICATST